MRLNKFIAHSGLSSRRKAENYIRSGKIKVNGKIIVDPSYKVKEGDRVYFESSPLNIESKVTYALNKPLGYVSTVEDPHAEKKVVDLIKTDLRLYPIGRLDKDSSGLIFLSNDGDLANVISHPSKGVEKTYLIRTKDELDKEDLRRFRRGIKLDKMTSPAEIEALYDLDGFFYQVKVHEGMNRQIRRMVEALGNQVLYLKRLAIGEVELGSLKEGDYRKLTDQEINSFK